MASKQPKVIAQFSNYNVEIVEIAKLKEHKRNYRKHPEDQLKHIKASIKEHGLYSNAVIALDGTILAGHGVVEAAKQIGMETIPVIRLKIDPDSPKALKVLTGDNQIAHLGEIDDRLLTEILKEIKDTDIAGLLGTGFDENMLAALAFITRPESEMATINEAATWAGAGMPEYVDATQPLKIVVSFKNEKDREEFAKKLKLRFAKKESRVWTTWWPFRERDDLKSLKFKN